MNTVNPLNTLMAQLKSLGYGAPGVPSPALPATGASLLYKLGIIAAILVVIAVILVIVHYTIRPINEIIPVPYLSKVASGATTFWTAQSPTYIRDMASPIYDTPYNYSFAVDILVIDPMKGNDSYRPLMARSGASSLPAMIGGDLHAALGNVNVALVLEKHTNDLRVTTTLNDRVNSKENILLKNIPIGKPFTIGCVLGSNYMEVYMNGRLAETRAFKANPGEFITGILPPAPQTSDIARVRNVRIWPRALPPNIMRDLGSPAANSFGDITKRPIISSQICRTT